MQQLDNFCELIAAFGTDEVLLNKVQTASANLRKSLIEAVKELHPEHVFMVSEEESLQCSVFLAPYR